MEKKKVVVIGGGVLGSQIAYQSAYCGFDVTIWLRSEGSIKRCQPKIDALKEEYIETIEKMDTPEGKDPHVFAIGLADFDTFDKAACLAKNEEAYKNVKLELDMKKAFEGAYIIIESLSENKQDKIDFYKKAAPLMDKDTILVTNSSTMLPSTFAKYTGRANKYLSLHFANEIWKNNTAEVMSQKETSTAAFDAVVQFARDIRMIPLQLHKEKNGYLLNSMLIPFLFAALDLWATDIATPEDIDKAWLLGTGAPKGPFQICDVVGLKTCREIVGMYLKVPGFLAPYHFKAIAQKLDVMIEKNYLGVSAGQGFYTYNK